MSLGKQERPNNGNLAAAQVQHDKAAYKYHECQREKFAMIVDGRYLDPQLCKVGKDGAADRAKCKDGAKHCGAGHEQQYRGNQLNYA